MESPSIPFLDLRTPHRELEAELVEAFRLALREAAFVGGPAVETFEREFAVFTGTTQAVGVANGTDALRLAYLALGVRPGAEVISVSHTFIATTEAITQAGGRVRFVDIDPRTKTMDPAAARAAVTPNTVGIVPVHLYGQPADLEPLLALARERGLWLVEDAAQAHGATYRGKPVGSLGHLGCFSFYPGKNLGSLGEGGAVTGNDPRVLGVIRQLREHGQSSKYIHAREGYNARLHAIQAAFLSIKLKRLQQWNASRREVAGWYRVALAGVGDLELPAEAAGRTHVYHLYVVQTPARDALREHLTKQGIGVGLHYPTPLHLQEAYRDLGRKAGSLPQTERAAATCLSLPMFPGMTQAQVGRVAEAVRGFFGS